MKIMKLEKVVQVPTSKRKILHFSMVRALIAHHPSIETALRWLSMKRKFRHRTSFNK